MYYPKQIPYLLDKEFKENVAYTEYHIEELEEYCMCIWTMKSKKILDKTIANNILPDACVDIVIDFTNGTICFAGFSKETEPFQLKQNIDYMGVRLKPSIFYSLFHRFILRFFHRLGLLELLLKCDKRIAGGINLLPQVGNRFRNLFHLLIYFFDIL